jgi:MFS transporter, ACS family, hexuronate transporter
MALLRDREDEAMPPGGRPGAGAIVAAARERGVGVLFAAAIPWNMAQTNFFAYLTLFMRDAVQTSQPIAGVALAIGQSASAVGRIGWGVVSDTLFRGARKTLLVALCGAAALLLAAMALVPAGWVLLALGMTLALGLTVASFAALQQTLAVETVAPRHAGSAMGFTLLGSSFGGMIGPPIFGALVDFTGGFGWSWVLTGVLMMVGVVLVAGWLEEKRPADG